MQIAEIFYSLQGEGPFSGYPAIFVRFAGCPEPHCAWCDTKEALFAKSEFEISSQNALEKIETILAEGYVFKDGKVENALPLLVLTGGEPFYLWDREKDEFIRSLVAKGFALHWETSGRICFPDLPESYIVCSPKKFSDGWDFCEENLNRIHHYKFVIFNKDDAKDALEFMGHYNLDRQKISFMPGGINAEQLARKSALVAQICLRHGVRFSPRLHLQVFAQLK